jgi:hypothetical protein
MRSRSQLLLASVLGAALAAPALAAEGPLPWVEDDYARAVAQARAQHVPILLEAWAPW